MGVGEKGSQKRRDYNDRRNPRRVLQRGRKAQEKAEKAAQRYVKAAERKLKQKLEAEHAEEVKALKAKHAKQLKTEKTKLETEKTLTCNTLQHYRTQLASVKEGKLVYENRAKQLQKDLALAEACGKQSRSSHRGTQGQLLEALRRAVKAEGELSKLQTEKAHLERNSKHDKRFKRDLAWYRKAPKPLKIAWG